MSQLSWKATEVNLILHYTLPKLNVTVGISLAIWGRDKIQLAHRRYYSSTHSLVVLQTCVACVTAAQSRKGFHFQMHWGQLGCGTWTPAGSQPTAGKLFHYVTCQNQASPELQLCRTTTVGKTPAGDLVLERTAKGGTSRHMLNT